MNIRFRPFAVLAVPLAGLVLSATTACSQQDKTDFGAVAAAVATMLSDEHYSREDFDDSISRKALRNFLDYLDYNRMYFTRAEVETFREKYETTLDDAVLLRNLSPAMEIYGLFMKKMEARFVKIQETLESGTLDFTKPEYVEISRKEQPWPSSEEELDDLWRRQLKREVLQERLNLRRAEQKKKEREAKAAAKAEGKEESKDGTPPAPTIPNDKAPDTPEQKVLKRYKRFVEAMRENDEEDVTNFFLSAITSAYDPHSEYFSASEEDNFNINMRKSLVGIGARLTMQDGAAKIEEVIPGGPADRGKQLKKGDLIVGVGEGEDGEMKDVEGMKLQKIVELIRGEEGKVVRLKVQPVEDPSIFREIRVVRAKVEIKDTLAKGELIELNKSGQTPLRIGWIHLDDFYGDMENYRARDARSASRDVKRLLTRLQKENIAGLVLDLRGNGGGLLEEAIRLTGLFIKSGPVVQQRDKRDDIEARFTSSAEPFYTGPLVVVTDRFSASASEICAAALQDYGRAVIVGDKSTFGKGTVQQVLRVGSQMKFTENRARAGSLKLTIQKFYRIAGGSTPDRGGSTQKKGVISDVILPSRFEAAEIGEQFLKDPLPYDEIPRLPFEPAPTAPLPIDELRTRSAARVKNNPEFNYIADYVRRTSEIMKRNRLSLNESERIAEEEENQRRLVEQREERRARLQEIAKNGDPYKVYPLTLDNVTDAVLKTDEELKTEPEAARSVALGTDGESELDAEEETFPHGLDPVKAETLEIVRDLVELTTGNRPAANTAQRG